LKTGGKPLPPGMKNIPILLHLPLWKYCTLVNKDSGTIKFSFALPLGSLMWDWLQLKPNPGPGFGFEALYYSFGGSSSTPVISALKLCGLFDSSSAETSISPEQMTVKNSNACGFRRLDGFDNGFDLDVDEYRQSFSEFLGVPYTSIQPMCLERGVSRVWLDGQRKGTLQFFCSFAVGCASFLRHPLLLLPQLHLVVLAYRHGAAGQLSINCDVDQYMIEFLKALFVRTCFEMLGDISFFFRPIRRF
jgi:hypothetical protein